MTPINKSLRSILLAIGLIGCVAVMAQYSDKEMYHAYLTKDMGYWNRFLHAYSWDKLSVEQRKRYINYEYGFVATAIDEKHADAEQHIEDFGKHIQAMIPYLPQATILTYQSSYAAYRAKFYTLEFAKQGVRAMSLAKQAVAADPKDPLAQTLMGCVDFYAPSLLGGSKTRALRAFQTADSIFVATGDTILNWNYASLGLQLAMCLDKTGQTQKAIRLCESLLKKDPDFLFIRNEYLPELRKKDKK